ncbi:MAG: hypothetical protein FJ217_03590 [Ignavibacteria bacterium]|nr:hypothetical protein [Ignavibacteria bacterium]
MNPDKTYSVDSSTWLASGEVIISLAFGNESSVTGCPMKTRPFFIHNFIRPFPDTMLASEKALARDWDSPEEDVAWSGL